jgi:hypothetical protein
MGSWISTSAVASEPASVLPVEELLTRIPEPTNEAPVAKDSEAEPIDLSKSIAEGQQRNAAELGGHNQSQQQQAGMALSDLAKSAKLTGVAAVDDPQLPQQASTEQKGVANRMGTCVEPWSIPEWATFSKASMSQVLATMYNASLAAMDMEAFKKYKKAGDSSAVLLYDPFNQAKNCLHVLAEAYPNQLIDAFQASIDAVQVIDSRNSELTRLQLERLFNAVDSVERQLVSTHQVAYDTIPVPLLKKYLEVYPYGNNRELLTILARYLKRCPRILRYTRLLYTLFERLSVAMISERAGSHLSRAASNAIVSILSCPRLRNSVLSVNRLTLRNLVDNIPHGLSFLPEKNGRKLVNALLDFMQIHGRAALYPDIEKLIADFQVALKNVGCEHFLPSGSISISRMPVSAAESDSTPSKIEFHREYKAY